jgi:hypothetical protein
MLKLFYKTLLVSLISGSLLMLDFSFKGSMIHMNSVQAETLKTEKVSDADLMGTLTMTVVGTLASRLYTYKMTTDIMLAAAGGAIFLGGEVLAYLKLKTVMKDIETEITRDDKGKIDQKQIEVLEKLKQSYAEAKNTASTKKNLQMAAAAAFAAAGIMAYTMAAGDMAALTTCTTGVTTGLSTVSAMNATCSALTAGTYTAAAGALCYQEVNSCIATITAYQTALMSHEMARQATTPSLPALTTDTATGGTLTGLLTTVNTACIGYAAAGQASAASCTPLVPKEVISSSGGVMLVYNQIQKHPMFKNLYNDSFKEQKIVKSQESKNPLWNKYLTKTLNFIMPEAHAELFSAMGIASSAAISYLMMTSATLGPTVDIFMLTPRNRAMVWGVLAGLTFAATSATDSQIQKIEENISKIDAILHQMYALENGIATANNASVSNPKIDKTIVNNTNLSVNDNKFQDVDLKANGGPGLLPCITGSNPDNCPNFTNKLSAQADVKSMPDFVQAQIGSISKLTDGINGKSRITAASLDQAQIVAGQQGALSRELLSRQKALQQQLKNAGDKTDLSKISAKLDADLKAGIQKELDKRKTTAGAMLASFGGASGLSGSGSGSSSNAIATDASKNGKAKDSIKGLSGAGNGVIAIPAAAAFNSKLDKDAELEAKLAEDKKAADEAAAAKGSATASMDDYALKNDITQDKDSSIFDLISNRYQKSYDRLFKRIK